MLLLARVRRTNNDPDQDREGNHDVKHIIARKRWQGWGAIAALGLGWLTV